ncbi:MAG: PRC-barrel domain-containing protein [Methylobacteriaceae bacterium]|nr:PRC-barrel domain-containing protein [Methylobacteriaceae bacterium]
MLARLSATAALALILPAAVVLAQTQPAPAPANPPEATAPATPPKDATTTPPKDATTTPPKDATATPAPTPPPAAAAPSDASKETVFYSPQQNASDWLSSNYVNHTVYGPKDEKLGKITDLVLNADGQAVAAIVGVGGFLGIGEKDVAVSFKALKAKTKNGSQYLTLEVTKDELKNAPKFTKITRQM